MACLAVGQVSLVEARLPAGYGMDRRLERIGAQVDRVPVDLRVRRWCSSRRSCSSTCAAC
jgi:hypothetical protein